MKRTKVQERESATLQTELGGLQTEYNGRSIEFKNAKGEARTLSYNRVDRNGAFVGDRETEVEAWDCYVAVAFKAQHEQKRALNSGEASLALKAGHSLKQGVASVNVRTSRMPSNGAGVTIQLARAQKLAKEIREIQTELAARAEAARVKAESETKAKADAELEAALMMRPVAAAA